MDKKQTFHLEGKNIVITGASRGIGQGVAKHLAAIGANVILVARDQKLLQETVDDIICNGGKACMFSADLRQVSDIKRCVSEITESCGKIDVLFNNAGMGIQFLQLMSRKPIGMKW